MKKIKLLSLLMLLSLISTLSNGQESFFEALAKNGDDAVYQRYGSVYDNDDGELVISGKHGKFNIVAKKSNGVYSGFEVQAADDEIFKKGKRTDGMDLSTQKTHRYQGYPNVSFIYNFRHRDFDDPWVAIGDYVFKLDGIYESGKGFSNIKEMYIKLGGVKEEKASGEKSKKKKFGSFMKDLKSAALNTSQDPGLGSGPEYDKARATDIKKLLVDYLTEMNNKQSSYTLTAQDKKEIGILEGAVDGYYKEVNSKNDAYWASAEGQAILENRRRADGAAAETVVTLKNNSNSTIYVATSGSRNPGTSISAGGSASWNCKSDAYLQTITKTGNTSAYSTTNTKVYSANSKCGGTMSVN